MKFKTKAEAQAYIKSHAVKLQRRMRLIKTRCWNPLSQEWQEHWSVLLKAKDTPSF